MAEQGFIKSISPLAYVENIYFIIRFFSLNRVTLFYTFYKCKTKLSEVEFKFIICEFIIIIMKESMV